MVILNFIHYSPDCQTSLEFPIRLSTITMTPFFFVIMVNYGSEQLKPILEITILILPNANMLVHRDKARSLNMLKQTKTTKTN